MDRQNPASRAQLLLRRDDRRLYLPNRAQSLLQLDGRPGWLAGLLHAIDDHLVVPDAEGAGRDLHGDRCPLRVRPTQAGRVRSQVHPALHHRDVHALSVQILCQPGDRSCSLYDLCPPGDWPARRLDQGCRHPDRSAGRADCHLLRTDGQKRITDRAV